MKYILWRIVFSYYNFPKSISGIFTKIRVCIYNIIWHVKYKISYDAKFNMNTEIAKTVLKSLYWLQNTRSVPVSLVSSYLFDESLAKWHAIIRQIRFAFFYYMFILNDIVFYMPKTIQNKLYYKCYLIKKYWYVKDFLTDSYFNYLMPDSIFEYIYNKEKNKYIHLPTQTTISRSDYITLFSNSDNLPVYDFIQEPLENYYKKGMELFIQFFEFLWK